MPGPKEKSLSALYLDLHRYEQNEEYERALKTCNRILNTAPNEAKALHCKIVCFIHVGKFEEALQLVTKNPELTSELYFEKAYCQYRLNQPEQALVTANAAPELNHQLTELKAQILYRLEQYGNCYGVYRDVFKNVSDEYNDERLANLNAIIANLKNVPMADNSIVTYEIIFNVACQMIDNERFVEAEKKLKLCEKMCRESLNEDECTEEEIDHEVALIKVQLAYCYQRQSRVREAQQLYTAFFKQKSDNVGLVAVASNNAIVINKEQNIFDSKRKIKYATQELLDHKLNSYQRKCIAFNHSMLTFYFNQLEECRKLCDRLISKWPEMSLNVTIIKALVLMKENNGEKAVDLMEDIRKTHPDQQLYIQLVIVHFLLCQGEKMRACDVLYKLCNDKFSPGMVGALVTIYLSLNDEPKAAKVFEDAIAWYHGHQGCQGDLGNMWMQAAEFHMRHGHPAVAAKSLEELLKKDPDDQRTIARAIMAYVQFDIDTAKKYSDKLPSTEELTKDLDADEIEATSYYGTRTPRSRGSDHSPGTPNSELIVRKSRRKRRGKLPAGYNLEILPDPERWLPKYDRIGYRKRSSRRNKDIIKGSQGSSSTSDIFDFSKAAEKTASEETIESGLSMRSSNSSKSIGSQNSKKNKRKTKW